MFKFAITVSLDNDDRRVLEQIAVDLSISRDEVIRRAIRLAGSARALNNLHGVVSDPDDMVPEGVIW